MGKRKQKVRWCTVDGLKWTNNEDESSPEGSVTGGEGGGPVPTGSGRRGGVQNYSPGGVAPRFEKRPQNGHVYYEGEYCEAEEMPNGFTKIRSKNLDILFKREYYEQRLHQQRLQEQQKQEQTLPASQPGEGSEPTEIAESEPYNPELTAEDVSTTPGPETQPKPFRASKSLDQIDPASISEFRPMNSLPLSGDQHQDMQSGQHSPYYPGYYTEQGYYPAPSRPNLYLYSPSNNTLIPCEEIIIPNPAVSGEGPVYPGPTNIYLAYPVSGPDGRGYITQPFSPPLPQEYMSYPSYSPSISDGSHYHSSTPQTPNSGHDSGSSTQPASPPPLVNYHPANWFQREAKTPDFLQNRSEPEVKVFDSRSRNVKNDLSNSSSPDTPTVQYIPGLPPQVQATTPKKSQKKKKKKKPQSDHRDSLSSESELSRIYGSGQETGNTLTNNSSPVLEVNLTDDLADFMVNPPTEPECSDEETLRNSSGAMNQSLKRDDTILNLKDLPNDLTNLELETFQNDPDPQNLVDSGIEKDLEEMLISDLESKRSLKSDSDDSFDMVSTTIPPFPEPVKDPVPEVEELEEENVISFECDDMCVEPVPISTPINQKPDLVEPFVDETDHVEVSVEPDHQQVVEVLEKELEVQEITTPVVVPLETESLIPEPYQGPLYTAESSHLSDSHNVPAKPRKKRTKKKTANMVLTPEKSEITSELQDIPIENASKMSYSAVCKTSDHKMNSSQQTQEPEPEKKPAPVVLGQERETSKSVHTPVDLKPEEWETVPHALSNPGNWEKKQKKNKKKKLSSVSFEEIPEIIETQEVHEDSTEKKEEMPDLELIKPVDPVRVERLQTPEIELKPEDECEEKKKNKKKKKKHGSEEPEEKQHKILICDNQIEIRYSRSVKRACDVLDPDQIECASTTGYCDILIIEKLGCGIARGSMSLGRLYQGRYVPPERQDGILPPQEDEADQQEVEEHDKTSTVTKEEIDLD